MKRTIIHGFFLASFLIIALGQNPTWAASSTADRYLHVARLMCGAPSTGMGFAPGQYETAINVMNPDPERRSTVKAQLRRAADVSQGASTADVGRFNDVLGPFEALRLSCDDIRALARLSPDRFLDGYLVLESERHLEVTAVYTLEGEKLGANSAGVRKGTGVSIDVERIPGKRLPGSTPSKAKCNGKVTLNNRFRISCLGAEFKDGKSVWRYRVEALPGAKKLKHWVLGLPGCARIVSSSPRRSAKGKSNGHTDLIGVNWKPHGKFHRGDFMVELSGDLSVGQTTVAAKGKGVAYGTVQGPVCR